MSQTWNSVFPPATSAQWRALVDRALGGAPFESLVSKTYDGIEIAPLYAASSDDPGVSRGLEGAWRILTRIDHPEMEAAIEQARQDLENGADGLQIVCANSPSAFGFGVEDISAPAVDGFFDRLGSLQLSQLDVDCPALSDEAGAHLLDAWALRALGAGCTVSVSLDPLGEICTQDANWPRLGALISILRERGWRGRCLAADARRINAAGGSEAQELAFALASGLAALRGLERAGLSLADARGLLAFRLALDTEQFFGVAKLRALRMLWARVEEACGLSPRPIHIQAETAWRMMTQRDPWANVLRAAVANFSAALGGADAITLLPFTQALGLPDAFARRLARNTQLVLLHEAHLAKVADPAAGSGAFEALTRELCWRAWALFQEIEHAGGLAAALASGAFQDQVQAVRLERKRSIARRIEAFVGASEYPDLAERPVETLAPLRAAAAREGGAAACFALFRGAEPFERLRDRSDARLAATGVRPSIFLVRLGSALDCGESLAAATNLFQAGGVEAVGGDEFNSGTAAAFVASGAKLACLCPAGAAPVTVVSDAAAALAKLGARLIYCVGSPSGDAAALVGAGVAGFVFAGCDALSILEGAHACAA